MSWEHAVAGVAVVLALEGLVTAAFPDAMRRVWSRMAAAEPGLLRRAGLVVGSVGTAAAWMLTRA